MESFQDDNLLYFGSCEGVYGHGRPNEGDRDDNYVSRPLMVIFLSTLGDFLP